MWLIFYYCKKKYCVDRNIFRGKSQIKKKNIYFKHFILQKKKKSDFAQGKYYVVEQGLFTDFSKCKKGIVTTCI